MLSLHPVLVVGIRPEIWRSVVPADAPHRLHGFDQPIVGPDGFTMPATQADLFVWIAGASHDIVFDASVAALNDLAPMATVEREVAGWTYQRNRDLTGFEDGTENPDLVDAPGVALVAAGLPGAGGRVLLVQKWRHDFSAWSALAVSDQECVIGRTKLDSVEFPAGRMPRDSHVSRTVIKDGGEERKIFRRNTPYGSVGDHGTMFIGFANDQGVLGQMLERMAGVGDAIRDALTRYTTPLAGAYYFVPSPTSLAGIARKS